MNRNPQAAQQNRHGDTTVRVQVPEDNSELRDIHRRLKNIEMFALMGVVLLGGIFVTEILQLLLNLPG